MELDRYLAAARERVERHLESRLPPADGHPPRIHEAIRYAALGPGKRLRPILVLAATELCGRPSEKVLDAAIALELIHAATLALDDLPAMDDARLRRGRPAVHVAYGEAAAILAAVALLVHAYELIAVNAGTLRLPRERLVAAIRRTSAATGSFGLVAGQFADLQASGHALDVRALEYIHSRKTGQLFVLAATLGPLLVGAEPEAVEALEGYARNLGLAYQVIDDLLDRAGSATTGKDQGRDQGRTTFASLVAPEEARGLARDLASTAKGWLGRFGRRGRVLAELADLAVGRER